MRTHGQAGNVIANDFSKAGKKKRHRYKPRSDANPVPGGTGCLCLGERFSVDKKWAVAEEKGLKAMRINRHHLTSIALFRMFAHSYLWHFGGKDIAFYVLEIKRL